MPYNVLQSMEKQLLDRGYDKRSATNIAAKKLQEAGYVQEGTLRLTEEGVSRGEADRVLRKKERYAKKVGRPVSHITIGISGRPKVNPLYK